jgi:hypothetical protein
VNKILETRFQSHQNLLIESASVISFKILALKVSEYDGRVRIRAKLRDGGLLEFAEYIELNHDGKMIDYVYSFHWQNAQNQLVQRWDNVAHYPQLPFAPHPIHQSNGTVEGNPEAPTLASVLKNVAQWLT